MSKNKSEAPEKPKSESIRGAVGGQAVIEGVMMKTKDTIAIAVRRENGEIVKKIKPFKSIKEKSKILNIPIIRGFVNFIEMLSMSMSTLNESADMLGLDEEFNKGKKEKENENEKENKEKKSSAVLMASIIGTVLGLLMSFGLFFFLPTFIGNIIKTNFTQIEKMGWLISIIEGVTRFAIFVAYILLVTLIPDIKRTFQYHGAEHMSVFCCEAEEELTVENARKHSRFHPRCGTSFMIVMMIIGIIISALIPTSFGFWLRLGVKFAIFPFVIGIGYEFIKYAGKHDSVFVKIISAPGIWIQRLTTKKPDDRQLEVALVSLRIALKIDSIDTVEEPEVIEVIEETEVAENAEQ